MKSKITSHHLELDVKRGRRALEKEVECGEKVKVMIEADIYQYGNDDGVSTVFYADVKKVERV